MAGPGREEPGQADGRAARRFAQGWAPGMRLNVDLRKTADYLALFFQDTRFYYDHDPENTGAKHVFGKSRVFTKPIQKIRHHLDSVEAVTNTRTVAADAHGDYILVPKCNFDAEISVDAIRLVET